LSGDPSKAGMFTVEFAMPSGYQIRAALHPTDEVVEVKKARCWSACGDKFDASKAKPMKAGDKGTVPAKAHHFAAAQGATFISVTAMGRFALDLRQSGGRSPEARRQAVTSVRSSAARLTCHRSANRVLLAG